MRSSGIGTWEWLRGSRCAEGEGGGTFGYGKFVERREGWNCYFGGSAVCRVRENGMVVAVAVLTSYWHSTARLVTYPSGNVCMFDGGVGW